MKRALLVLLILAACQPPQQMPEPDWIADAADVLSTAEESELAGMLLALNDETAVEMACVIVKGTGELPVDAYAEALLWRWELGLDGVFNGILVLIDTRTRQVRLARGDGMRWTLQDEDMNAVLEAMTADLAQDRYFSAIRAGIEEVTLRVAGSTWEVTHFDLKSLPANGAEGAIVSFEGVVQDVRGDTVFVLSADSVRAKILMLSGTSPMVMEDLWYVHARVKRREPLELLLLGLQTGEAVPDLLF